MRSCLSSARNDDNELDVGNTQNFSSNHLVRVKVPATNKLEGGGGSKGPGGTTSNRATAEIFGVKVSSSPKKEELVNNISLKISFHGV